MRYLQVLLGRVHAHKHAEFVERKLGQYVAFLCFLSLCISAVFLFLFVSKTVGKFLKSSESSVGFSFYMVCWF